MPVAVVSLVGASLQPARVAEGVPLYPSERVSHSAVSRLDASLQFRRKALGQRQGLGRRQTPRRPDLGLSLCFLAPLLLNHPTTPSPLTPPHFYSG